MKEKKDISTYLIAVLLFSLVLLMFIFGIPASAYDDHVNKYVDYNPTFTNPNQSLYGFAQIYIRAGSAQDMTVFVLIPEKNLTFNKAYLPDHQVFIGKNDYRDLNRDPTVSPFYSLYPVIPTIDVRPDGTSALIQFPTNTYIFYLKDGNGNQPEFKKVHIGGGATEYVTFLGAAISTHRGDNIIITLEPTPVPTIGPTTVPTVSPTISPTVSPTISPTVVPTIEPTVVPTIIPTVLPTVVPTVSPTVTPTPVVCHTVYVPEVNHTILHPAGTHIVLHNATPAWTEYFGDYKYEDGIKIWVGIDMADWDVTFEKELQAIYDYRPEGDHFVYDQGNGYYVIDTVVYRGHVDHPAVPAWAETVLDPAWLETVVDQPAYNYQVCEAVA